MLQVHKMRFHYENGKVILHMRTFEGTLAVTSLT